LPQLEVNTMKKNIMMTKRKTIKKVVKIKEERIKVKKKKRKKKKRKKKKKKKISVLVDSSKSNET
jgi:hypothetical protein